MELISIEECINLCEELSKLYNQKDYITLKEIVDKIDYNKLNGYDNEDIIFLNEMMIIKKYFYGLLRKQKIKKLLNY